MTGEKRTGEKCVPSAEAAVTMAPEPAAAVTSAYLDYAAATPLDPEVLAAMMPYLTERFYNPSAPYALARGVRSDVEAARATVARCIGARPGNVTFTAGATEANNLAFAATEGHVVTDAIEHESVLACAAARPHAIVGVGADGRVDPEAVREAICPQTQLVSIELANGEIGCVQPIREVARVVSAARSSRLEEGDLTPLLLHVDASQAAGCLTVNVGSLCCDLLTLSAAKIAGPKQVGVLWASDDVRLRPLVLGGGQESGVRSGTENVAGIVGMSRALELACARRGEDARRMAALRDRLEAALLTEFPWAVVSGPRKAKFRLPGLLHVSFPGLEARRLVIGLEREGVSVGTGSACAASKMRVSHVLRAIGMPDAAAEGSLRLTLGRLTTQDEVDYAVAAICRVVGSEMDRLGLDGGAAAARAATTMGGAC